MYQAHISLFTPQYTHPCLFLSSSSPVSLTLCAQSLSPYPQSTTVLSRSFHCTFTTHPHCAHSFPVSSPPLPSTTRLSPPHIVHQLGARAPQKTRAHGLALLLPSLAFVCRSCEKALSSSLGLLSLALLVVWLHRLTKVDPLSYPVLLPFCALPSFHFLFLNSSSPIYIHLLSFFSFFLSFPLHPLILIALRPSPAQLHFSHLGIPLPSTLFLLPFGKVS